METQRDKLLKQPNFHSRSAICSVRNYSLIMNRLTFLLQIFALANAILLCQPCPRKTPKGKWPRIASRFWIISFLLTQAKSMSNVVFFYPLSFSHNIQTKNQRFVFFFSLWQYKLTIL